MCTTPDPSLLVLELQLELQVGVGEGPGVDPSPSHCTSSIGVTADSDPPLALEVPCHWQTEGTTGSTTP
jgi:hypothetical protein